MSNAELQRLETDAGRGDAAARVALGNRLLASNRYDSPEFERGVGLLEAAAEDNGSAEASWYLGALYLSVSALPDAHATAARWLGQAASRGVPGAVDRLADLHLQGLGVERDPGRAVDLQRRLAEQGFQAAAWQLGYLLGQALTPDGGPNAAATAFARACALGHPEAYYSLGLRFALGAGVDRDPAFARALLIRGADGGCPDARGAADELVPRQEHGREAKRWYDLLKPNLQAAQGRLQQLADTGDASADECHPLVVELETHLQQVGHPALVMRDGRLHAEAGGEADLRTRADDWEWLSERPRVGISRGFATREECSHLIMMIGPHISDPRSYSRGNAYGDLNYFSGEGCPVGPMIADSVIRLMEQRIARMTDHDPRALEPCSIVHYRHNQEYRPHTDFFTEEQLRINREQYADAGGQRLATFLLYLQPPAAGGETRYVEPDVTVAGETGLGILHYNVTEDGAADGKSTHVGMPVKDGEKWLWRSALRERPLDGG